jgi:membrane-associated phospholipid phosphatase
MLLVFVSVLFSCVLIPAYIFYLKKKGSVDSMDINLREQRMNPLILGITSYFIGFLILSALHSPNLVQGLMFCYASNTLLVLFITHRWKVSVHATSISGPLVALTFQFGMVVLPFYILIPIVATSRVILKRHTVGQVIVGSLIGLVLTSLQLRYLFL